MIGVGPTPETFDRWAESYGEEANPFHSLDRRALEYLLPSLAGRTVLDIGCGNGRNFELLIEKGCTQIHGVDMSSQMLAHARKTYGSVINLHHGCCESLTFKDASFDVAVCSLVFGYIRNPRLFFQEVHRILRPGGTFILTDIHPETSLRLRWKRSFQQAKQTYSVEWNQVPLESVRQYALLAGLAIISDFELPFASPEKGLFESAGRQSAWQQASGKSALYALRFVRTAPSMSSLAIRGRIAMSGDDAPFGCLHLDGDRIQGIRSTEHSAAEMDLSGLMLLPGLVNAHDHLEFGLFPRLGSAPYDDAVQWAGDIHTRYADIIAWQRAIPRNTRYRFGALRNLLSGVTTVCHHNPIAPEMRSQDFPVRIADRFRWAHSPHFDQQGLLNAVASPDRTPFVVHAGEGTSSKAIEELHSLERLGLLRPSTVLVHALAANSDFLAQCRRNQVGIMVCPSSNDFLFSQLPREELLTKYPFAAIGSDSPLTSCGDLLDEVRVVAEHYPVSATRLYSLVTESARRLLQLQNEEGTLRSDGYADLIAVMDRGHSPAETLRAITWKDVLLVIRGGKVLLVSEELLPRVQPALPSVLTRLQVDGEIRWVAGDWKPDFDAATSIAECGSLRLAQRSVRLA